MAKNFEEFEEFVETSNWLELGSKSSVIPGNDVLIAHIMVNSD